MRGGDRRLLGAFGEDAACAYLKSRGYKIVGRNFACRFGEVDIIAQKGRYIVFVEVKLRKSADFGAAKEFVTAGKQRRVILAAQLWLAEHGTPSLQPRFDVAEVYAPQGLATEKPGVTYIENAYDASI